MGRPQERGVAKTHVGVVGIARCLLRAREPMAARLRLAWDDHLVLRINGGEPVDLGHKASFASDTIEAPLSKGANTVVLKLSNDYGSNHGGWAFAFQARAPDGTPLLPEAE